MEKHFGRYSVKPSPLSGDYFVFDDKENLWLYRPDVICFLKVERKDDKDLLAAYEYCESLN